MSDMINRSFVKGHAISQALYAVKDQLSDAERLTDAEYERLRDEEARLKRKMDEADIEARSLMELERVRSGRL